MELSTTTSTTTASTVPTVSTILFGKDGSNPLPMLEKLWDFYSSKGNKTVFVNIGTSSSPLAELEIAESLGCPIHIVEPYQENRNLWNKVLEILKTRKISEETDCDFTKNVSSKWVLSKNLHLYSALPFFYDGLVKIDDVMIDTVIFKQFVKNICSKMNIPEDQGRIDLVNLQINSVFERYFLYALIDAGYRPGLVLVTYNLKPDYDLSTSQVAAHLQNVGYNLLTKEENKFLYVFNNDNIYEITSYENTSVKNPLVNELLKASGFFDKKLSGSESKV
jgi:hypothetical protein